MRIPMINWKLVTTAIYGLVLLLLVVIAGLMVGSALELPSGVRFFSVQSNSMSPIFDAGSIVIVKSSDFYQVGDIITFKASKDANIKNPRQTTTHRLIEKKFEDGNISYITKGDANNTQDIAPVIKDLVLGKVIFSLPLLGRLVSYTKTVQGLIILIVIPATIIAYAELINLKNALVLEIQRRRVSADRWERIGLVSLVFVLSFALGFITVFKIGTTYSFLAHSFTVSNNVFSIKDVFAEVSLDLSDDKKKISFTVNNIAGFIKLSYELTYDTNDLPQGFKGTIDLHGENEVTRDLELATCTSGGTCVYHTGVKNFQLKVDLEDGAGNKTSLQAGL